MMFTCYAIFYECGLTIMSIEADSGLRVLGINIMGRFVLIRKKFICCVSLAMLKRMVNVGFQAVQRRRATVIDCV